jgi:hypothetical protein
MKAVCAADFRPPGGLKPRAVVMAALPDLATIPDAEEWGAKYQQVLDWAAEARPTGRSPRGSVRAGAKALEPRDAVLEVLQL